MNIIPEETIFYTLAQLMATVRWTRVGDTPDARRFKTISRRVALFSDVPSNAQPACYQAEHATTESEATGFPGKSLLEANWIIYQCVGKDKNAVPAIENNLIIGGVRKALAPKIGDPGYPKRNTLGGLVHHCYIGGRIFKDPGDIDDQGMLVIPIKVLVP